MVPEPPILKLYVYPFSLVSVSLLSSPGTGFVLLSVPRLIDLQF